MRAIESRIAEVASRNPTTAHCSVVAEVYRDGIPFELCDIDGDRRYMAASIAKLGIALRTVDLIDSGKLRWAQAVYLKEEFVRPGTGVLGAFQRGMRLSLWEAFNLMLSESDNTATNMVLSKVGTQSSIIEWLDSLGITGSGLAERDDNLFESAHITATDALALFTRLHKSSPDAMQALRRNHYTSGLQANLQPWPYPSVPRYKVVKSLARLGGLPWVGESFSRVALDLALHRRISPVGATKDGLLNVNGHRYKHNVGRLEIPTGGYVLIAALSSDCEPALLPMIGQLVTSTP